MGGSLASKKRERERMDDCKFQRRLEIQPSLSLEMVDKGQVLMRVGYKG